MSDSLTCRVCGDVIKLGENWSRRRYDGQGTNKEDRICERCEKREDELRDEARVKVAPLYSCLQEVWIDWGVMQAARKRIEQERELGIESIELNVNFEDLEDPTGADETGRLKSGRKPMKQPDPDEPANDF